MLTFWLRISEERETTANQVPDVPQKIRSRFKPTTPGSGGPPFTRIETEHTSPEYRMEFQRQNADETAAAEKDLLERLPRGEYRERDREGYRRGHRGGYGGEGRGRREDMARNRGGGGGGGDRQYESSSWWGGNDRGNEDKRGRQGWQNDDGGDRYNSFNHGHGPRQESDGGGFQRRRSSQEDHYGPASGPQQGNQPSRNRGNDYYGPSGQNDRNHYGDSNRGPPHPPRRGKEQQSKWEEFDQQQNDYPRHERGPHQGRKRGYEEFQQHHPSQPQTPQHEPTNDRARGYSFEPAANRPKPNH